MLEAEGDLWEYPADARVITTNGFLKKDGTLVMGRGVALQAKTRYPILPSLLGNLVALRGNVVNLVVTDHEPPIQIATLPVKHVYWRSADTELIKKSLVDLVKLADEMEWKVVALPRPGCGNGGLSWEDVKPLLVDVLDDRFVVVNNEAKAGLDKQEE